MKILEQILEEIGEMPYPSEGIGCGLEDFGITDRYEAAAYGWNEVIERIGEIICSHMEDGTKGLIDVEDERFWNILFEEACVEGAQAERILKRLKEICAPRAQNDGWVPAEKALPEKYCMVWLSFTNQHCSYSRKAYWDGRNFRWCSNGIKIKEKPMAWQPYYTPKPYHPKEE